MAASHHVELLARDMCGDDILTCSFSRPDGYRFSAGQWCRLTLATPDGPQAHTFSHCSGPADAALDITTRLSPSAFKVAFAALRPGDAAEIAGPGGRLSLPQDVDRFCFLVGGVGITPIRSMLRDAEVTGRTFADALLLYGNRDETCVPFAEEFRVMEPIGVRTVVCYEHPPTGWAGEAGFITPEVVRRHVDPKDGRLFVVTGPPVMVSAMEIVLDDLEIPVERRLIERFA